MQGFGCTVHGRQAFGGKNGFLYSAELPKGEGAPLAFRFLVDGDAAPAVKRLKAQGLEHVRWLCEAGAAQSGPVARGKAGTASPQPAGEAGAPPPPPGGAAGVLVGLLSPPSDFYARGGAHSLLAQAADALRAEGLACPERCPLCGLAGCDGAAFVKDEWRAVHLACLSARLNLREEDYSPPARVRGSYAGGALGAFTGALVGALPIWAQALSSGEPNWALYAFIPFLSALCYRLCRGRALQWFAAVCVGAASLLMALALEQLGYQIALSGFFGRNVPFGVSIGLYFSEFTFFEALRQMLFRLLALLIGYVAAGVLLRRYAAAGVEWQAVVRGAAFVRGTALPLEKTGALPVGAAPAGAEAGETRQNRVDTAPQ